MRNFIAGVCLVGLFFMSSVFASTQSDMRKLELSFDTDDLTMYTMIYTRELREELANTCSSQNINDAKSLANGMLAKLEKKYASMNDAETLRHSHILYERLRMHHTKTADKLNVEKYCTVKYLMYEVQQYLRDVHLGIFEDTGIMKDFGGFQVSELHGYDTKRRYLEMLIDDLQTYKDNLGTRLIFSIKNKSFKDAISTQEKKLLELTQEIMELSVYKALYDLKKVGLFTQDDINELKDKTTLEYVDQCGNVNGRYEIKETLTSAGKHIRYATEALNLKVNLCGNFFMIRDIQEVYEKIVIHELGHHFFYYHDREAHDDFIDICWGTDGSSIEGCGSKDFVSDYARSHGNEDYAEHFMYWFLDIPRGESTALKKKTSHFEAK